MNKRIESTLKLEQVLHQALSGLPPRRAPSTLQSRVPTSWRAAHNFLVAGEFCELAGGRARYVRFGLRSAGRRDHIGGVSAYLGDRSFDEASAVLLSWAHPFLTVVSSAGGLVALLVHVIPRCGCMEP